MSQGQGLENSSVLRILNSSSEGGGGDSSGPPRSAASLMISSEGNDTFQVS